MTAREQLIELMQGGQRAFWEAYEELGASLATEIHSPMGSVLDAILSDAGRPLLWSLLSLHWYETDRGALANLVEYLKERGVLVQGEHMGHRTCWSVRLPGGES